MPELTYREFQSSFNPKKPSPIYLFHGEEDFHVDEGVDRLIADVVDASVRSFNLDVVYGSKSDAKSVLAIASSFPMMSERRVVVVKEFEKLLGSDTAKELISSYVQRPLESTCLILVSAEPDFRKKPFPLLKKSAVVIECKQLYDNQIPPWIIDRVKSQGKAIDIDASQMLQAYAGNSLRSIQNEIEKLFIFVGDRKNIAVEDVAQVVGATRGFTIFDLQNAVGRRDMKDAIRIMERMLELGESPQLIIVMLTRFLHQMWKLSDLKSRGMSEHQMAAEVRVHPFFLKQYLGYTSQFNSAHIEHGFKALLEADEKLKSTMQDQRLVLDILLYALVRGLPQEIKVPA